MGKIKNTSVSNVNLMFNIFEETDLKKLKELDRISENTYKLKTNPNYDSDHFVLGTDKEFTQGVMHFNIPKLHKLKKLVEEEFEYNFKVEMLIQEELGVSFNILYYPVHSFGYQGFQNIKCSGKEYLDKIKSVEGLELKKSNEEEVVFYNKENEIEYNISIVNNKRKNNDMVKHEFVFKNPEIFFSNRLLYAHLEEEQILKGLKLFLKSLIKSIKFN